jgi:hypothetical protein
MAALVVPGLELVPTRPPATRTLPVPSSAAVLPKRHSVAVPAGGKAYTGQQTLSYGGRIKALPMDALWSLAP